jgi:exodeoxyribonuclease III
MDMKIISWNVNGLRANHKKGGFDWLLKQNADCICLQETKAHPIQLDESVRSPKGYHSYFNSSDGRKGYSGVALYTKEKPLKVFEDFKANKSDAEGRIIGVEYELFYLINTYFPNGGGPVERLRYKLDFYENFLVWIEKIRKSGKPIIFCGDVNVAHTEIDLARPKENVTHVGFLPEERAWVDKVLKKGYVDAYRHFFPDKKGAYTYWDMKSFARDRNVGWRIDYFFVTPELVPHIKTVVIRDEILGSDHCPIELQVDIPRDLSTELM